MRFEFAVVADLSANVLSACLVIFLVLAGQAAEETARRKAARPPLDVTQAFETVRRVPLSASERVEMLRLLDDGPGLRIDLYADGVAVGSDPSRRSVAELGHSLDAAGGAIRLYVFQNEHYAAVVQGLNERERPFREITVPDALRAEASGIGENWSPAFLQLVARGFDIQTFAIALAELLGGASGAEHDGFHAPAADPQARSSLVERVRSAFSVLLSIVVPLAGVATVVAIERKGARRDWAEDLEVERR